MGNRGIRFALIKLNGGCWSSVVPQSGIHTSSKPTNVGLPKVLANPAKTPKESRPTSPTEQFIALGIDIEKARRRCPAVLNYDEARLSAILNCLRSHEVDAEKVVRNQPILLQSAVARVEVNFDFLRTLQIDVRKAVESCPGLLMCSIVNLQSKMDLLLSLDLKPFLVLKRFPCILTYSEKAIRTRIDFLTHAGLDAVRIINQAPHVVGYDIERTLRRLIEFITKEMGRSLQDIQRCPRCLSCSLDHRLEPRFRYMMLYGKRKDYSLSTLSCYPDHRFVKSLAFSSLEHYHIWLKSYRHYFDAESLKIRI